MEILEEHLSKVPEGPLYHYTSTSGLIGILKTKTLWATSHFHLNDEKEYKIAAEMLRDEITKISLSIPEQEILYKLIKETQETCFIASFSEQSDLLSQWRAYCPDGNGYCLGFGTDNPIFNLAKQAAFFLIKCEYDQSKQRAMCKELMARFKKDYIPFLTYENDQDAIQRFRRFTEAYDWLYSLIRLSSSLKHASFAEECEWRLVSQKPKRLVPKLRYRSGRFGAVPYYELPLAISQGEEHLDDLVIWPNANGLVAIESAKLLLETCGFTKTCITLSESSFR